MWRIDRRLLAMLLVSLVLATAALFILAQPATAQTVGMYPYSTFEAKHLPMGTPVWANFGGNECAYPRGRMYPLADDHCFNGLYLKAWIVEVFVAYREGTRRFYAYRVRFESIGDGHGRQLTRAAFLDDAFIVYNMPPRWAEWSRHFILLNW